MTSFTVEAWQNKHLFVCIDMHRKSGRSSPKIPAKGERGLSSLVEFQATCKAPGMAGFRCS